jgi:hypothetical protein
LLSASAPIDVDTAFSDAEVIPTAAG